MRHARTDTTRTHGDDAGAARRAAVRWRGALVALAFVLVAAPRPAVADQPTMSFVRLGADEGLSQGSVMAIAQDGHGFLWFGTEDGLNRYDGFELRHVIRKRDDPTSLPGPYIAALAADARGRLWVATDGDGLVWRDPATGRFLRPTSTDGAALLDPQARIRSLLVDNRQNVWIATRDAGLVQLDPAAGTARRFRRDLTNAASLSDDSVFALAQDPGGDVWVGTAGGLDRIDLATGGVERRADLLADALGDRAGARVTSVLVDRRGTLWVGTDAGLVRVDVTSRQVTAFRHVPGDDESLPSDRVTALLEDDESRLWVGTTAGLALLDRRSGRFTPFRHESAGPSSLPDSNVVSLFQDRGGVLWVGTKSGGIARWNPRSWSLGHFRFRDGEANNVTSFAVDPEGTLWLGSFGSGVSATSPREAALRRYARATSPPLRLSDDNVMALLADPRGRIWIGTMTAGVERLDPKRRTVTRFRHDPADPASLPAPGVMALMQAENGTVWVGTYGGGVASIDPATDRVRRYPLAASGRDGLSSDRATAFAEDPTGLVWIGTDGGGLNVLDPSSGRFRHFVHDPTNVGSLASNTIYSLHVDERGRVWVGTRGGGLDLVSGAPFAPGGVRFRNYSESEGLPNGTVYGIESDASGRLWMSTNRGIASLDPATGTVRVFRRSHGLQGDEFNFGAHHRGPDGTLYFGGPNGYNAFVPERLRTNARPPDVALTDVLRANTPVAAVPESLRSVDFRFRDDVVTFRFAALDFAGPAENRYQYRLEGFDTQWIDAGTARQATYTNLSGGAYRFRVRASNSDGVWNENGIGLDVAVEPPPWATPWARLLYVLTALVAIAAVAFAHHRRVAREAAYAHRLQCEVDTRTAELADRNRDLEVANRQLRDASLTDPLTSLGNRRALRDALLAEAAGVEGEPAREVRGVLMVVDLDHLKPINDQFGHDGGDAVLLRIAEILRALFRTDDLIVRWGGDEFVVWCRRCDLDAACLLAERLRSAVSKTIFRVGNGAVARTSCSIGFAAVPFVPGHPEMVDWEQSMNLADAALYRAKQDRNSWFGWSGTPAAAVVPSLLAAIEADEGALEADGVLVVRRRPLDTLETLDNLRPYVRPESR